MKSALENWEMMTSLHLGGMLVVISDAGVTQCVKLLFIQYKLYYPTFFYRNI